MNGRVPAWTLKPGDRIDLDGHSNCNVVEVARQPGGGTAGRPVRFRIRIRPQPAHRHYVRDCYRDALCAIYRHQGARGVRA